MRRTDVPVACLLLVGLVATTGCLGILNGNTTTLNASKATVNDAARAETGYERMRIEQVETNRTFEAAGQRRTFVVNNWLSEYQKRMELGSDGSRTVAAFVAFSTPQADVGPKTFNPVGDYSNRKLVERFTSRHRNVSNVRRVGTRNVTMLGTEATVAKFAATTTVEGEQVDIYVHSTSVKHGDDFVVALGAYPRQLEGEQRHVLRLIEGVEHGE